MTEHFFEGIVFECDKERVISVYSPLTGLVEVKKTQFSARDIRPSFGRSCSFRLNFKVIIFIGPRRRSNLIKINNRLLSGGKFSLYLLLL